MAEKLANLSKSGGGCQIPSYDFNNPITLTNGAASPSDGLAVASSSGANNQYLDIRRNSVVMVMVTTTPSGSYGASVTTQVKKGDILSANCYGSTITSFVLYPLI